MRRRTAYPSPPALSSPEADRAAVALYNVFPDIAQPTSRAYYLPLIDAVYLPILNNDDLQKLSLLLGYWHETTHSIVASALAVCEQRYWAFSLLAGVAKVILDAEVPGHRLRVPSFTLEGPDGENHTLRTLADRLDELFFATGLVHEVIAGAIQAEVAGWDRRKARQTIRESLHELCLTPDDERFVNASLDEPFLDEVLDLYEQIGPEESACSVGFYALNAVGLSRQQAFARLRQVVRVARTFEEKHPRQADLPEWLVWHSRFSAHLSRELPEGANWGWCPLAGACLPGTLEQAEEVLNSPLAGSILRGGAQLMRYQHCGREEGRLRGEPSALPDTVLAVLRRRMRGQRKAARKLGKLQTYVWPLFRLSLVEDRGEYGIGSDSRAVERAFTDLMGVGVNIFDVLRFEALRQQLWYGKGLMCYCHPDRREDCSFRPVLAKLWKHTVPDPKHDTEWQKPDCI